MISTEDRKVTCKSIGVYERALTKGNVYPVVDEMEDKYRIVGDHGRRVWISKFYFVKGAIELPVLQRWKFDDPIEEFDLIEVTLFFTDGSTRWCLVTIPEKLQHYLEGENDPPGMNVRHLVILNSLDDETVDKTLRHLDDQDELVEASKPLHEAFEIEDEEEAATTFPVLLTERFCLRQIQERDVEQVFAIFSDPDVMKYYGAERMTEQRQAMSKIWDFENNYAKRVNIRWAIARKEDDVLVGTIGFHAWDKAHDRAEIGYELERESWGKGILSEVIRPVLQYGFDQMSLNRIEGRLSPANVASGRVLEKAGFLHEGTLWQYLYMDGKYHDTAVYALVKQACVL